MRLDCVIFNNDRSTIVATAQKETLSHVMSGNINATKSKDSGEVIKNYHKQAFECISKALRIDEDDSGLFMMLMPGSLMCVCVCVTVCNKHCSLS